MGPRLDEALSLALARGDTHRFQQLASAVDAAGSWPARLAAAVVEAIELRLDVGALVDEVMAELRHEASDGLRAMRVLASLGSASGLIGACIEFFWLMAGDHGPAGFVAGLPQQMATSRAVLSMAIGFAITLVALSARSRLGDQARVLFRRAQRLAANFDRAGSSGLDGHTTDSGARAGPGSGTPERAKS